MKVLTPPPEGSLLAGLQIPWPNATLHLTSIKHSWHSTQGAKEPDSTAHKQARDRKMPLVQPSLPSRWETHCSWWHAPHLPVGSTVNSTGPTRSQLKLSLHKACWAGGWQWKSHLLSARPRVGSPLLCKQWKRERDFTTHPSRYSWDNPVSTWSLRAQQTSQPTNRQHLCPLLWWHPEQKRPTDCPTFSEVAGRLLGCFF